MKNWITENLLQKNKLISKRCRKTWFENTDNIKYYDEILRMTSFLESDASLSQRIWHIYNDVNYRPKCKSGNGEYTNFYGFSVGYREYSSNKAAQNSKEVKNKIKKNNIEKWGVGSYTETDEFKEKAKKSWLSNYGVDNPSKSPEIVDKKIKTCLKNWNTKWPQQSQKIRNKSIKTNLDKYGFDNPTKSSEIRNKTSNTRLKKEYDRFFTNKKISDKVKPLFDVSDYDGINQEYKFECKECGSTFEWMLRGGKIPRCFECYPKLNTSLAESEVCHFIENELNIDIEKNNRTILNGQEIDIFIPSKNIGIEYNGLYYHSEITGNKDKNYHLNKTIESEKNGIHLIQIFEDEWLYKTDIVKRRLTHLLNKSDEKVYARKCEIKEISSELSDEFLEENHIQGKVNSSIRLGIYYKENLLGVMLFSKRKIFNNDGGWEMTRFATSTHIVGGFSKMLSFFEKTYNPKLLTSYALRRWTSSNENVYTKNGFDKVEKDVPGFFYTKNGMRYNRINFQKWKLKDKLENFDNSLTEWQNMQLNGWDRIWDAGSIKFQKTYNF